jgi:hypothetical protein
MRSMKKMLAALLAVSMIFSTLCMAAAYSDDSAITQTKAVTYLTEKGILNGKSDGRFDPKGQLTRGEMAKMIYALQTGSADASAYDKAPTTFTDIAANWSASYVKYAVEKNILAGRSATIFDPTANVTGLEEGKMLLVYLGKDPNKEGLTGANWDTNTKTLGEKLGLFDSVSADLTQPISREDAAQLMYNAIQIQQTPSKPSEPSNSDWDSGKVTRNKDNRMAGLVTNSYLAQNSDKDKRLYLDILTADGKKRSVETDIPTSAPGVTRIQAGSILSFWGSNYQSIEDLSLHNYETTLSATSNYAAIKSYNETTGRVSFYQGLSNGSVKTDFTSAKITSDTLVIYVDQSNSEPDRWEVLQEGGLNEASAEDENSYTANCFVSLRQDDTSKIDFMIVEVNGEIHDTQKEAVILTQTKE